MSTILEVSQPDAEPVSLDEAIAFLRLPATTPDATTPTAAPILPTLITAARRYIEGLSGWTLASRDFVQYEDGFYPFYSFPTSALFGPISSYPYPGPYPFPGGPLSPFEKRLLKSPVTNVSKITYIGGDGKPHDILPQKDFVVDLAAPLARVAPLPGSVWPQAIFGINTVQIRFTAGYEADPLAEMDEDFPVNTPPQAVASYQANIGVPAEWKMAIFLMLSHFYFNRDAVVSCAANDVPHGVTAIVQSGRVLDFGPVPQ